jgi:hypothetical protein
MKVENCRAPARGGHRIHWREGGRRRTNLKKGNITRLRARTIMFTDIVRITELAKEGPKRQFSSIAHLITVDKLEEAFRKLRKDASAGIDGVTYQQYETNVEENIRQLHQRLKEGKYRAEPLRRVYIPKEDGKQWWGICSTPSTSRIFSNAPTGFGPDGGNTKPGTKWEECCAPGPWGGS